MLKVWLDMWDYEVSLANTAAEGLRLAQSEHFDMYLLDTRLQEASGFDLCEQICEVIGQSPVVFLSAAAYETDKQRGLQAGALAYLTKPVNFDLLGKTMARLLMKHQASSQLAA